MIRGLLTDGEWAVVAPFVIETGPLRGRPCSDHRRVLDAIFSGSRARAHLGAICRPNSAIGTLCIGGSRRWTTSGLWDVLLQALADSGGDADAVQMIDSTIVWAHHCRRRKGRTQRQCLGRSRGGFSIKIHLRANAEGLPISIVLAPGEAHDSAAYPDTDGRAGQ